MTIRIRILAFTGVLLTAGTHGLAQLTSGDLVGLVTDSTGAVVAGATIEAIEESTQVHAVQMTGSNGQYRFNNLPIGRYDLTVNAPGFSASSVKGISIDLNKTATQNFTLDIGKVATTVDVSDAVQNIDTTTAQIQTNFTQKLAADLPIAGNALGGVLNLSLLSAGVANAGGVGIGDGPSVGGQRPYNNNFTIEGIDNNEKSTRER